MDVFQRKVNDIPLTKYFDDYKGDSYEDSLKFIVDKFISKNKTKKALSTYFLVAIDEKEVEKLIENIIEDQKK